MRKTSRNKGDARPKHKTDLTLQQARSLPPTLVACFARQKVADQAFSLSAGKAAVEAAMQPLSAKLGKVISTLPHLRRTITRVDEKELRRSRMKTTVVDEKTLIDSGPSGTAKSKALNNASDHSFTGQDKVELRCPAPNNWDEDFLYRFFSEDFAAVISKATTQQRAERAWEAGAHILLIFLDAQLEYTTTQAGRGPARAALHAAMQRAIADARMLVSPDGTLLPKNPCAADGTNQSTTED